MTFLPSKVHTGACSSSSTRSVKYVPLALSSLSWSVRYESGLVRVVVVMIPSNFFCHGFKRIYTDSKLALKHNRIPGGDAGLTQQLHVGEELFLGIRQNVAGVEHEAHLFQQLRRFFAGDPIASVRTVVKNFLQQYGKPRSWAALQATQKTPQVPDFCDVAEKNREQTALVLTGLPHPLVMGLPFLFGRIARQRGFARLVENEPGR